MHFISDIRYNPRIQCEDHYYRIKESYRDETGKVKTCQMLNLGFMEEKLCSEGICDIGKCLTYFMKNGTGDGLFGDTISEFNSTVQGKACKAREYWEMMAQAGTIQRCIGNLQQYQLQTKTIFKSETL